MSKVKSGIYTGNIMSLLLKIVENSRKQGELLGTPEVDNQQPSLDSNIFEGSTTNDQIQTSKVEDGNIDTSALPNILNISDDIV